MSNLPDNLFSPTFRQQKLGFLFAAIMGIMVYLATLAMALQVGIASAGFAWDRDRQSRLTVELPPGIEAEKAEQVLSLLRAMPEVQSAAPVPDAEVARLLSPWIKDAELLKTLPLPQLLDIRLETPLAAELLEQRVRATLPTAHVDDHAEWMAKLQRIVKAFTALGWLLIGLTSVALVIAISLLCRTALAVEQRTVKLLHIMGATDHLIASSFARHARRLAWPAALTGFLCAVLTAGGLAFLLKAFAITEIRNLEAWILPASFLLIVPCLAILGAVMTARLAVLSILSREP